MEGMFVWWMALTRAVVPRDVDYNELMDIIAGVGNIIAENGGYDCILFLTLVFYHFHLPSCGDSTRFSLQYLCVRFHVM